jgi:thiamine biosynthesis lipoprotein
LVKEKQTVRLMGTIIDLTIEHDNPQPILTEAIERLKRYEKRFSANDSSSELMAVNLQAGKKWVQVHPELFELIEIGKRQSLAKDSHLNIAIGPLIQTWRIGFSDAKVPSQTAINHCLSLISPENILLNQEQNQVYLAKEGMKIDLGCLAKGYIADLIVKYLKEVGVKAALINLGGNLVTFGKASNHSDQLWRIGIQNPTKPRNQSLIILKICDQSVVTSGVYERSLTQSQKTYHHIFNPQTGYPIETSVVSLTIVSKQSIDGEIWTTRLFGHTPQQILAMVDALPDISAIVITNTGEVYYSPELKKYIA